MRFLEKIKKNLKNFKKRVDFLKLRGIIINVLSERAKQTARLCNGSTTDSDSVCKGSNPFRATKPVSASVETGSFFAFFDLKIFI